MIRCVRVLSGTVCYLRKKKGDFGGKMVLESWSWYAGVENLQKSLGPREVDVAVRGSCGVAQRRPEHSR